MWFFTSGGLRGVSIMVLHLIERLGQFYWISFTLCLWYFDGHLPELQEMEREPGGRLACETKTRQLEDNGKMLKPRAEVRD